MCDYIFTWGKEFSKKFSNKVRSETIELGSFKNNLSQIKKIIIKQYPIFLI